MVKCSACGKFVSPAGAASCTTCPLMFHKGCVGIPDQVIISTKWNCPECKKQVRRGDNSTTPIKGISGHDTLPTVVTSPVVVQSESYTSPHVNKDLTDVQALKCEIAEYMNELREFRKEMVEFRDSVAGIGQRMDGIERRLAILEQRETTSEVKPITELEGKIMELQLDLNDRDQELLLSDLDIGNFPEEKGENVYHNIITLASKLGIKIEDRDIVFAERMGVAGLRTNANAREGGETHEVRARRIVVRLARRQLRDDLLRAARVRRNLNSADMGLAGRSQRIFINERLTRANRQLFYKVREECRKQNWRYSWTKRGRIYVRQNDGKQAFFIRSEVDIVRVFGLEKV